jgi:DNA-binding response OmpR family regulator
LSVNKLLVVEDESITSDLLRRYFEIVGYSVLNALTGTAALEAAAAHHPAVIILDINLPDMDGYQVCERLRADPRTNHIPIIFLTRRGDRHDRLNGLRSGGDDYLAKPFDVDELRLRVHNIVDRMGGATLVDARTSLPNTTLIKERLPRLLEQPTSAYLDVQIEHLDSFTAQYGPVAANQVIRTTAKLIGDLLHEIDPLNSFIGHPRDDRFFIVADRAVMGRVRGELAGRFREQVEKFYDPPDLARIKRHPENGSGPLMSLKMVRVKAEALRAFIRERQMVGVIS